MRSLALRWRQLISGAEPSTSAGPPALERPRIGWTLHEGERSAEASPPLDLLVNQEVLRDVRRELARSDDAYGFLVGRTAEGLRAEEGAGPVGEEGTRERWVLVEEALPAEGAGFLEGEEVAFRKAVRSATDAAAAREREVVGWFHRHGLLGPSLTTRDVQLHRACFPHPWQVALVAVLPPHRPAGAFLRCDPGHRYSSGFPVPFQELVDGPEKPQGAPMPSYVDWRNHRPSRAVLPLPAGEPAPSIPDEEPEPDLPWRTREAPPAGAGEEAYEDVVHGYLRRWNAGDAVPSDGAERQPEVEEEGPAAKERGERGEVPTPTSATEPPAATAAAAEHAAAPAAEEAAATPAAEEPAAAPEAQPPPADPAADPRARPPAASIATDEAFQRKWLAGLRVSETVRGAWLESARAAPSAAPAQARNGERTDAQARNAEPADAQARNVEPADAQARNVEPAGAASAVSQDAPPSSTNASTPKETGDRRSMTRSLPRPRRSPDAPPAPLPSRPELAPRDQGSREREEAESVDLARYWRVLWRRRALAACVCGIVVGGVMLGTLLQTPVYRATGMLEIRNQGAEAGPMEAVFGLSSLSDDYLETQYGVLRSRSLAERVARDLGLAEVPEFNSNAEGGDGEGGEARAALTPGIVSRFQSRLLVNPVAGSRLVRVSVESEDPQLAADAVNSVFANLVDLRVETGQAAVARLARQVDSVRARLQQSETGLQEYMRENGLVYLETADGDENAVSQRLGRLQEQITEAENQRFEKEARYDLVRRGEFGLLDSQVLESLSVRLADLRGEYARLRSTFTDDYPRTRQVRNQVLELEAEIARERERIASEIRSEYQAAAGREALLRRAFDEQRDLVGELSDKMAAYRILRRDVDGQQQLYSRLQQQWKEADVSAALAAADVAVVDAAVAPTSPIRPDPKQNFMLALMGGLVLGVGSAFLREHTDRTVHTAEEVDALVDVPVLGSIPSAGRRGRKWRPGLERFAPARLRAPHVEETSGGDRADWYRIDREDSRYSSLAEAFGGLRTSMALNTSGHTPRSLVVTSAQPREGKTTIVVNLALSLARLGRRVLLVDADVRRPSVHRAFKLGGDTGLVDFLTDEGDWRPLLRREVAPGLDVLPAGPSSDEAAELFASGPMAELVREAELEYDFVLVDAPAVLVAASDARVLGSIVEGVVIVLRSRVTPKDLVRRAIRQMPRVIGVVLNAIDPEDLPAGYRPYLRVEEDEPASVSRPDRGATAGAVAAEGPRGTAAEEAD